MFQVRRPSRLGAQGRLDPGPQFGLKYGQQGPAGVYYSLNMMVYLSAFFEEIRGGQVLNDELCSLLTSSKTAQEACTLSDSWCFIVFKGVSSMYV